MTLLTRIGQVLTTDLTKELGFKKNQGQTSEYQLLTDMRKRRSFYELSNRVSYSPEYLIDLIKQTVRCCPSALNSQSARVVILLQDSHFEMWQMVKDVLRQNMPAYVFEGAEIKIDRCAAAYGTVLFFEDQDTVKALQKQKPLQADEFKQWSEQTSGMVQFAVWTALAGVGLGASLHHYNPSIDAKLSQMLDLPPHWALKAQLVFGGIMQVPEQKHELLDDTVFRIFS